MASAIFQVEDTKEARTELSLLLQIEPSQISRISHNGLLTVEFSDLAEDKALQVLSRAVSNHGFAVSSALTNQSDSHLAVSIISRPVGLIPEAVVSPKGTPVASKSKQGNKD